MVAQRKISDILAQRMIALVPDSVQLHGILQKVYEELPPDLQGKPELQNLIRKYRELGDTDEMVFKKIHAVYLGMVSYTDMLLGRVLDALDRTGLAANTTVIASSDHGDWAGDWGLVEKWPNAFDDDLTRVPLIIRRPGCPGGIGFRN